MARYFFVELPIHHTSKSKCIGLEIGLSSGACCCANEEGRAEPGATAYNAFDVQVVGSEFVVDGVIAWAALIVRAVVFVLCPFPNIAGHVQYAVGTAPVAIAFPIICNRCCAIVKGIPAVEVVGAVGVWGSAPGIDASISSACCFFPFGFGGQASAEPCAVFASLKPVDVDNGMFGRVEVGQLPFCNGVRVPLGIADFCVVYVIGFEVYGVFWAFVADAVVGAHFERSFGYCDEGVDRAHRSCDLDTCLRLGYNRWWRLWIFRRCSGFVFASGQRGREDDEIEGCAGEGFHSGSGRAYWENGKYNSVNIIYYMLKEKLYAIQVCPMDDGFNLFSMEGRWRL